MREGVLCLLIRSCRYELHDPEVVVYTFHQKHYIVVSFYMDDKQCF